MAWQALLGQGISDTIHGIYNIFTNERQRKDQLKANETNWQRSQMLTHQTWARDDNAVQRRVEDLKAAGLSPILAAGSPAGVSAPIKAEAHGTANHAVSGPDIMYALSQKAQYDHTVADKKRIETLTKDQHLINTENLRELRFNNDLLNERLTEERMERQRRVNQELRAQNEEARRNMIFAIEHERAFQDLLTSKLNTEIEAYNFNRLREQGGAEVSNANYNALMNLFRARNIHISNTGEETWKHLLNTAIHTRLHNETVLEAMERIARQRREHPAYVDALRRMNRYERGE